MLDMGFSQSVEDILAESYQSGNIVVIFITVFIYLICGLSVWALIQGGCLFEAGCLLNFHHFQ